MSDAPKDQRSDPSSSPAGRHQVRLRVTPRFDRAYKKLPDEIRPRIEEALRQFKGNPRHPGLHFEKLSASVYRTIRLDRKMYRIVLRDLGDGLYELVDVDRHAVVDRKYG